MLGVKDHMIFVTCPMCGEQIGIPVTEEQFNEYYSPNRRHIQDIFPELNPEIREMLISGCCPECWDKYMMF